MTAPTFPKGTRLVLGSYGDETMAEVFWELEVTFPDDVAATGMGATALLSITATDRRAALEKLHQIARAILHCPIEDGDEKAEEDAE